MPDANYIGHRCFALSYKYAVIAVSSIARVICIFKHFKLSIYGAGNGKLVTNY